MQKHLGWLWTIGFVGWFGAADAQTASPPADITQFDGTYAFVSATNVNETFLGIGLHPIRCGHLRPRRPLIIVKGQVQHSGPNRDFKGTVGLQGELTMHADAAAPAKAGWGSPGIFKNHLRQNIW